MEQICSIQNLSDGWMDGRTDGWIDGLMSEWKIGDVELMIMILSPFRKRIVGVDIIMNIYMK